MCKLKIGDVVCLKSDPTQKMTIDTLQNKLVTCVYFDTKNHIKHCEVSPESLMMADTSEPTIR